MSSFKPSSMFHHVLCHKKGSAHAKCWIVVFTNCFCLVCASLVTFIVDRLKPQLHVWKRLKMSQQHTVLHIKMSLMIPHLHWLGNRLISLQFTERSLSRHMRRRHESTMHAWSALSSSLLQWPLKIHINLQFMQSLFFIEGASECYKNAYKTHWNPFAAGLRPRPRWGSS